jgi:predicted transposase/invertase (TIGR01784 family)
MPTLAERLREEGRREMQTLAKKISEEAKQEGIKEERIETAKRMLHDGLTVQQAAKYTGLHENEIRQFIN